MNQLAGLDSRRFTVIRLPFNPSYQGPTEYAIIPLSTPAVVPSIPPSVAFPQHPGLSCVPGMFQAPIAFTRPASSQRQEFPRQPEFVDSRAFPSQTGWSSFKFQPPQQICFERRGWNGNVQRSVDLTRPLSHGGSPIEIQLGNSNEIQNPSESDMRRRAQHEQQRLGTINYGVGDATYKRQQSCCPTNLTRGGEFSVQDKLARQSTVRREGHCYNCNKCIGHSDECVIHPLWVNDLVCNHCAKIAPRCLVCERPSPGWNEPRLSLGVTTGRETFFLCLLCYNSGTAQAEADLEMLITEAVDFLRENPLIQIDMEDYFTIVTRYDPSHPNPSPILHIKFASIHSLSQPFPPHPEKQDIHSDTETAWTEEIVMGKFVTRKFNSASTVYEIQLCYGLQLDTLVSILTHEMLHAVICLQNYQMKPNDEEFLCNAVSVLYLESQVEYLQSCASDDDVDDADKNDFLIRAEICRFRCRRLCIGDIPATEGVKEALESVKSEQLPLKKRLSNVTATTCSTDCSPEDKTQEQQAQSGQH